MTTTRIPAGWYPDPLDDATALRRWWSGEMWTEYTAPLSFGSTPSTSATTSILRATSIPARTMAGAVIVGTALAPTAHDAALVALSMTLHPGSPATSPWDALPSVASATVFSPATLTPATPPTAGTRALRQTDGVTGRPSAVALPPVTPVAHRPVAAATRAHTPAVWIMTAMPAVQALLIIAMVTRYPRDTPGWAVALALLLPALCSVALATVDAHLLIEDGRLRVAPSVLALLVPAAYLITRAALLTRSRPSAWMPLAAWAAIQAAVLGCWFLLAPASVTAVVALIV